MKKFPNAMIISLLIIFSFTAAHGFVQYKNKKAFIIDQTGDKLDVTQAMTLGFDPEKFQYGIGKTAFTPLDDSHIKNKPDVPSANPRVIGIKNDLETHAYSVDKLWSHEIANIHIGSKSITAAYWPLANLTAVYSREIDGQTLTLAPSGWTYNNTFVL